MSILKIAGIALIATTLALVVKRYRPEAALQVSIAAGVLLLLIAVGSISGLIDGVIETAEAYGIDPEYFSVLVKTIGVAYVAQLASVICSDAGENAIASKVDLCGRLAILVMVAPTVFKIIDMVKELLGAAA
ncbi:MAG: SpoIIIAC/SpoIIIAD family protein [Clostridia bacterium]|nr:SpoIIIAC/SpoIIIAD family protein [Clostridia bacterium]